MRHHYECQLRWADMDQLRHVNNVKYADYLQEARIDFLRAVELRFSSRHDEAVPAEERSGLVVVRHELTYLAPLHFDFRPVSLEIWVSDLGRASFTLGCEIFRDGPDGVRTVYLRAATRIAPFVFGTARPRRLSEVERAALAAYVELRDAPAVPATRPGPARRSTAGHYPVHVRFSDLDPYRHVNNVTYLEYFQEGRILFNSRIWHDLPAGTPRTSVVVAQADYDYLRPMVITSGGYDLWTWVDSVGNRSAVMSSEICDGDTVMSRSRVVLVFFDSETDRSTEPPAAYRDPLVAALETHDDPGALTRTS
ncbi:MAG: acyl-CoA thioesterase [Nocardioides sp.]|nr:acyl-CoA thioesterase [Nocardioides sp.]